MDMSNSDAMLRETRDRSRRIETRLTRLAETLGVSTGATKPVWDNGRIVVPSTSCSLKDCIAAVPAGHSVDRGIEIYVQHDFLAEFFLSPSE